MSKEKITPLHSLTNEEEELNKENEWFEMIKGDRPPNKPFIRAKRPSAVMASRSQRSAIIGEHSHTEDKELNRAQRKATNGK